MLNLNRTALARQDTRLEGEIPVDDPIWEGMDLKLIEPLHASLTASSVGEGVLVRGQIRTRVALECRRCLAPVEWPLEESVDLLFEPLDEAEALELEGEVYPLPKGTEIDLREPLREQLLLNLPEFVACRDDCRGLCPQCGANRNETECGCVSERLPSPWDALKNVKFD
jgi:uncharacterized protein